MGGSRTPQTCSRKQLARTLLLCNKYGQLTAQNDITSSTCSQGHMTLSLMGFCMWFVPRFIFTLLFSVWRMYKDLWIVARGLSRWYLEKVFHPSDFTTLSPEWQVLLYLAVVSSNQSVNGLCRDWGLTLCLWNIFLVGILRDDAPFAVSEHGIPSRVRWPIWASCCFFA